MRRGRERGRASRRQLSSTRIRYLSVESRGPVAGASMLRSAPATLPRDRSEPAGLHPHAALATARRTHMRPNPTYLACWLETSTPTRPRRARQKKGVGDLRRVSRRLGHPVTSSFKRTLSQRRVCSQLATGKLVPFDDYDMDATCEPCSPWPLPRSRRPRQGQGHRPPRGRDGR